MCFTALTEGGKMGLIVLFAQGKSLYLTCATILSAGPCIFTASDVVPLSFGDSNAMWAPDAISVFCMSHSGRFLVLGGNGHLQFWEVCENQDQATFSLFEATRQDEDHLLRREDCVTTCLAMPAQQAHREISGLVDWIVVGTKCGRLYGFPIGLDAHGKLEVHHDISGIFPESKKFDTPVAGCIPHYDVEVRRVITRKCEPAHSAMSSTSFQTLTADGKLCTWSTDDRGNWKLGRVSEIASGRCTAAARLILSTASCAIAEDGRLLVASNKGVHPICSLAGA